MKNIILLLLLIIVLFQSSCLSYKKEIYRSDSSLNKGSAIINSLKVGDIVKVGLKNGEKLRVTIKILNEKEIYGSSKPNSKIFNKIIRFEDIDYIKIGKKDLGRTVAMGLLTFYVIVFITQPCIVFCE